MTDNLEIRPRAMSAISAWLPGLSGSVTDQRVNTVNPAPQHSDTGGFLPLSPRLLLRSTKRHEGPMRLTASVLSVRVLMVSNL